MNSGDRETLYKTVYGESRGEPDDGQKAVTGVILNRAKQDKSYWGGSGVGNVCRHPGQFECWNGKNDIPIHEKQAYERVKRNVDEVLDNPGKDYAGGCDHFNNPKKEGYPDWTRNCHQRYSKGDHVFYQSK